MSIFGLAHKNVLYVFWKAKTNLSIVIYHENRITVSHCLGGKGTLEIISSKPSLATAGSAKVGFSGWYLVRFWVSPQMEVVDWWLLIQKIVLLFTHWDWLIIILMYENEHRLLHSHILLIRTHNKGLWSCFTERESKL